MARHDGSLQADREATDADMRLLLASLDGRPTTSAEERQAAIVCLLSASDGWRDASGRAGGAFANDGTEETGLKVRKGE